MKKSYYIHFCSRCLDRRQGNCLTSVCAQQAADEAVEWSIYKLHLPPAAAETCITIPIMINTHGTIRFTSETAYPPAPVGWWDRTTQSNEPNNEAPRRSILLRLSFCEHLTNKDVPVLNQAWLCVGFCQMCLIFEVWIILNIMTANHRANSSICQDYKKADQVLRKFSQTSIYSI